VFAGQLLIFSVKHLRSKFYPSFIVLLMVLIYSKAKACNSEMITVDLLKLYCFPFLFICGVDAMSLSSSDICILESCINPALFRTFGSCDKSTPGLYKICTGRHDIKALLKKRIVVFERPFVKRFALCYRSVVCSVCLSVLSCL